MADSRVIVYLTQGSVDRTRLRFVPEAFKSAGLFFRGPGWRVAWPVSAAFGVFGIVQEVKSLHLGSFWMWLFFGALSLVAASLFTFHRERTRALQWESELPKAMERLLQRGMDRLDGMVAAQKANPQMMGPWGEQEEEAWEFFYEARQLLIDHDKRSLLDDLSERTNEARRREQEKQRKPFEKFKEREEAGEEVSNAEKMRAWGKDLRRSSIGEMEAILSGVSKVAKHVQGEGRTRQRLG